MVDELEFNIKIETERTCGWQCHEFKCLCIILTSERTFRVARTAFENIEQVTSYE